MNQLFITLYILQLLAPIALLVWQWRCQHQHILYWSVQFTLVMGYLLLIAIAGLWTILPVFLPYLFLSLSLVLAGWRFICFRRPLQIEIMNLPGKWKISGMAVASLAIWTSIAYALSGWRPSDTELAGLRFPLKHGTFYIANGGANALLNAHLETLDGERFKAYRGQSFGVDIIQINSYGLRAYGILPGDPEDYVIFNAPVYAPCTGTVLTAENNRHDLQPPHMDEAVRAGNHIVLECSQFTILLAHFKRGSVQVTRGQQVNVGQMLARVGNTGETGEPHLHIHVQRKGSSPASIDGEPVWPLFDGTQFLVRNQLIVR